MSRKKARAPWQEDALKAIACLKNGGVILHATDTVWGLAADATNLAAVERIFEIKARPMNQPMLMLASNSRMVEVIQPHLPEEAWELMVFVIARLQSSPLFLTHVDMPCILRWSMTREHVPSD